MAQTINADDGVISGSTGLKFTADTTSSLALQTNGTTKVTIDSNGSVTIPNATSTSVSSGALLLTGTGGAIVIDSSGHKRISWNDGGGNFNIRAGHYYNGGLLYLADGATNGGAASITMNSDGTAGAMTFNVAAVGVGGTAVTWSNNMTYNATGLAIGYGLSPSYPLHISMATGEVYVSSSTGTNYVRYTASNTGGSFQFGIDNSAGSNYFGATPYGRAIFSDGAYPVGLFTNGSLRMFIDSSGNVGIGVTGTPATKLDVYSTGGGTATGILKLYNNVGGDRYTGIDFHGTTSETYNKMAQITVQVTNGGTGLGVAIGGDIIFRTNNSASNVPTEKVRIDANGNVGIGTTSPSSYGLLTVLSTTAGSAKINITDNSAGTATPLLQFGMNHSNGFNTSDAARIWTTATSSTIASLNFAAYNAAAPSTAQMVLNAGNLVLGNTTTDPRVRMVVQNPISTASPGNVAWFKNYSGTRASPSENADWPWPVLALTAYGNYYAQTMLSFTLPNDAAGQTDGIYHTDNSVWNFRLNGVTGSWDNGTPSTTPIAASTAEVGLQLLGPGNLRIGTDGAKSIYFRTNGTDRVSINSTGLMYHSASTGVSAAGATQGTATVLTSDVNHVTTVLASTGVRLPTPATAGLKIFIRNGGANALNVYPHSTGNIAGVGVDAAISVDVGITLEFIAFDTTNWYIPSAVLS